MGSFTGKCKYCGREVIIIAASQEDADRQASRDCWCGGAEHEEAVERRKMSMKTELMKLIGNECEEEGFRPLNKDTANVMCILGNMVVEGAIQKATIAVDGTTISIKGGEKIKVSRSMRYEQGGQV